MKVTMSSFSAVSVMAEFQGVALGVAAAMLRAGRPFSEAAKAVSAVLDVVKDGDDEPPVNRQINFIVPTWGDDEDSYPQDGTVIYTSRSGGSYKFDFREGRCAISFPEDSSMGDIIVSHVDE